MRGEPMAGSEATDMTVPRVVGFPVYPFRTGARHGNTANRRRPCSASAEKLELLLDAMIRLLMTSTEVCHHDLQHLKLLVEVLDHTLASRMEQERSFGRDCRRVEPSDPQEPLSSAPSPAQVGSLRFRDFDDGSVDLQGRQQPPFLRGFAAPPGPRGPHAPESAMSSTPNYGSASRQDVVLKGRMLEAHLEDNTRDFDALDLSKARFRDHAAFLGSISTRDTKGTDSTGQSIQRRRLREASAPAGDTMSQRNWQFPRTTFDPHGDSRDSDPSRWSSIGQEPPPVSSGAGPAGWPYQPRGQFCVGDGSGGAPGSAPGGSLSSPPQEESQFRKEGGEEHLRGGR
eukprot:GHVU01015276.1.p1 GENE.GHVU01015276.1~~GHVU01015276.1.p1  ORF type:complete len:342 (-),score=9.12 GHVU01015276.1:1517-2542(-)